LIISRHNALFYTATTTTSIYTLSLHDALPIFHHRPGRVVGRHSFRHAAHRPPHRVRAARRAARAPQPLRRARRGVPRDGDAVVLDRKSTRLNSSHVKISYAVFCLKKKTNTNT